MSFSSSNKSICLYPWTHLAIQQNGQVMSCCMALGHSSLGNLANNKLNEIWNQKAISDIRLKMIRGEEVEQCSRCYEAEEAGIQSHRQWVNHDFKAYASRISETDELGNLSDDLNLMPVYLEIRFSNGCNYRCRTCGPEYSSAWFSDAKFLTKKTYKHHRLESIAPDFKEQVQPLLPNLKKVYFAGGEPLHSSDHFIFLQYLVENNTTEVELFYDTNFSLPSEQEKKLKDLWRKFRRVRLSISLDDWGDRGEFIRKGLNWGQVLENRKSLSEQLPRLELQVSCTLSVLNIFRLPDFFLKLLELNFIKRQDFHLNFLQHPNYYNAKSLPLELKNQVEDYYKSFLCNENFSELHGLLKSVLIYMWEEDMSREFVHFIRISKALDALRSEKIATALPEYSSYFKNGE